MDALDILIVDEADRMLEAGFSDELNEIIASCPRSRQTMLFSATMTDSVDELVRLSLNKPVRLFVDSTRKTAKNLVQEFVRVREKGQDGQEDVNGGGTRAAILLALCKRTVKDKCIVFFRSKALAHQMRVMFGLCGLKAGELHGNLTQEQVRPPPLGDRDQTTPLTLVPPLFLHLSSVCKHSKTSRTARFSTCSPPILRPVVSTSRESRRSSTTTCPDSSPPTSIESVERPEQAGRDGVSALPIRPASAD